MALKTLTLSLKAGQMVTLDGPGSIRLERKSGTVAQVSVMADESVRIETPGARAEGDGARQAAKGIMGG